MPTSIVALDNTQYVRINTGYNPLVLEAHRDSVRVVVSELKPARGNTAFHKLGGGDAPLSLPSIDTNVWVLAVTSKSILIVTELDPVHVALHDGENNPISSYEQPATGKFILNTHDADAHNRAFNRNLHQHLDIDTTFAADSAVDDYIINVTDTTGFLIGHALHMHGAAAETTHPIIIAITPGTPGVLTLDRRLDKAHTAGDMLEAVSLNLADTGTLADPTIYWAGPEAGEIWHLTTLTLAMGHDAAGDLGKFGDLDALTNGCILRTKVNGNYGTLTDWKSNGDIDVDTGNVKFPDRSGGGGTYGTSTDGPFKARTGAVMRLVGDDGDRFMIYIQDTLTDINFWNMKVQGHFEG